MPKQLTGLQDKAKKYQHAWIYSSPARGVGEIRRERLVDVKVGLTPKDEQN
ncbi:hypothetical protein [Pandoraea cepalis]|uniref:hypothetical protein n=1 Tax=Pandoraea cepalis TaxID=2508294 RepID=UPI00263A3F72|nr:hypothetical protein [Pandoraea cepalis]